MQHPLISIIILTRDEIPGLLNATIRGVQSTCAHLSYELIVVDDASASPVPEQEAVRLLRHELPFGSQRARRTGADAARGEILVWLDAHMSFDAGWIDALLANLGPRTLLCSAWWNYTRTIGYCWGANFYWIKNPDRKRGEGIGITSRGRRYNGPEAVEVAMVIGACYMIRKDAYLSIGGLSGVLKKWGLEEADLSLRLWLTGGRVLCVPAAKVGHYTHRKKPFFVLKPEHLYNQVAFLRANFQPETAARLEQELGHLPPVVHEWLRRNSGNIEERRQFLERARTMSDADFCDRFGTYFEGPVREAFYARSVIA